jgi:predicted ATPase
VIQIVLTGGPGAGKTLIARHIAAGDPERFVLVPEAATQIYDALQTRWDRLDLPGRRDVQRKIYHLQVEQEERIAAANPGKILLLDRGTLDGATYWPEGPDEYWRDLGISSERELERYHTIIWLQTCAVLGVYDGDQSNTCRFEDAAGAIRSGEALLNLWKDHPRLQRINARETLDEKVLAVKQAIEASISPE